MLVDAWHLAASNASFDSYFEAVTDDFVFLGTAPGERWTKDQFAAFSKPYFDKGKAWDKWKIAYYNLTVLIENEKMKSFIELRDATLD